MATVLKEVSELISIHMIDNGKTIGLTVLVTFVTNMSGF